MTSAQFLRTMLKRVLLTLILANFLMGTTLVLAQTTKEKADSTQSAALEEAKIKELKEKLATKVAELRENQKRGLFGEIAALSKTGFTLVTAKEEFKVKLSEDTLIYKSGAASEGNSDDLKNSATVAVLGLFDETTKQLSAKVIFIQARLQYMNGSVVSIDKKEGQLKIKNGKTQDTVVDYGTGTSATEYDPKTKSLAKSGFSRFTEGDLVEIWGFPNEDDNTVFQAKRIVRIAKDSLAQAAGVSPSASPKTSPKTSPKASATPKASPTPKASA